MRLVCAFCWAYVVGLPLSFAQAPELCLYADQQGSLVQVNGRLAVPEAARAGARCFPIKVSPSIEGKGNNPSRPVRKEITQPHNFVAPRDIDLDGNLRSSSLNSPLGPIRLRWPRAVEQLFGRTPERAMVDAALTVSKAIKAGGFPVEIQKLRIDWDVVFIEKDPPAHQIPEYLRTNCHPAWIIPPSNVYVVAARVGGCNGDRKIDARVADTQLAEILVHEIGHAVEYRILKGRGARESLRAEGFATWFERYASRFSSLLSYGVVAANHRSLARHALATRTMSRGFSYTAEHYALASMLFEVVVAKRGIAGLMDLYEEVRKTSKPFAEVLRSELSLTEGQLEKELMKVIG